MSAVVILLYSTTVRVIVLNDCNTAAGARWQHSRLTGLTRSSGCRLWLTANRCKFCVFLLLHFHMIIWMSFVELYSCDLHFILTVILLTVYIKSIGSLLLANRAACQFVYSQVLTGFFALQWWHNTVQTWNGSAPPCQISTFIDAEMCNYSPKKSQNLKFCPQIFPRGVNCLQDFYEIFIVYANLQSPFITRHSLVERRARYLFYCMFFTRHSLV